MDRANPDVEPRLEQSLSDGIADLLRIVGKKDLYDFLGVRPEVSLLALTDRARELSAGGHGPGRPDLREAARGDLVGTCLSLFQDEHTRRLYDATLRYQKVLCLVPLIERECPAGTTFSTGLLADLVGEAMGMGIGEEEARSFILDTVAGRNTEVQQVLVDADAALARDDLAEALRLLTAARANWPGVSAIEQRLALIHSRQSERERLQAEIEDAITARRFVAAERLLAAFTQHPDTAALGCRLRLQIDQGLRAARHWLVIGLAHEQDRLFDAAGDAYFEALRECSDLEEARTGLTRCPPSPPTHLGGQIDGRKINLDWEASPSKRVSNYRLVRKAGSSPQSPTDGTLLAEGTDRNWIDKGTSCGEPYWYAAWSVRDGLFSAESARCGPFVRIGEVESLRVTARSRHVALEWQAPANVKKIEVWRKQGGPPTEAGDGVLIKAATLKGALDDGLNNGITYGYRVVAIFDGADELPVATEGVVCTAVPGETGAKGAGTASPDWVRLMPALAFGGIAVVVFLFAIPLFASRAQSKQTPRSSSAPVRPASALARSSPRSGFAPITSEDLPPAPPPASDNTPPAPNGTTPGASADPTPRTAPPPAVSGVPVTIPNPFRQKNPPAAQPSDPDIARSPLSPADQQLERMLLTAPDEANRQQWEQTWKDHLRMHIAFDTTPPTKTPSTPRLIGIRDLRIDNRTPCTLRVIDAGPLRSLRDDKKTGEAWELKAHRGLSLTADSRGRTWISTDLNDSKDPNQAGELAAAVRNDRLFTLQVIPVTPGLRPQSFNVYSKIGINKTGRVLYATYLIR